MSEGTPQPEKKLPPNRRNAPPNTFYARAAAEARRMQRDMSRELLISYAKTLFWTIPLTILIWVYAERQQSKTAEVTIEIGIKIDNPKKSATLLVPDNNMVICTVTGPQSQVDALSDELNGRAPTPVVIPLDSKTPIQDNSFPTLGKVEGAQIFRDKGLTVVSALPAVLQVRVDLMDEKSVPVVPPDQLNGHVTVEFSPPMVKIRGPHKALQDIQNVQADMTVPTSGAPTTQRESVPLKAFSESKGITISPDSVEASLSQTEPIGHYTVPKVVVYAAVATARFGQNSIEANPTFVNVKIVGPQDLINKIKLDPTALNVRAEMYFPGEEPVKDSEQVPLEIIGLPDGVHVDPDAPPLTAKIKVTQH